MRVKTGFRDMNGLDIYDGDNVWFEDELYKVEINPFGKYFVIDSDLGQEKLEKVHNECALIYLNEIAKE